jgi:hypothetical protein
LTPTMKLILNEESVRFSESKLSDVVFAQIFFEIRPEIFFPEHSWDDFVEIVLSWWMEEMIGFLVDGSDATLRFMDGDFSVTVVSSVNKEAEFRFFEGKKLIDVVHADFIDFSRAILVASRSLSRSIYGLSRDRSMGASFLDCQGKLKMILKDRR